MIGRISHVNRRDIRSAVYQREHSKHGYVPCYVCGKHVKRADATLEHILPKSLGGGDGKSNLSISHATCNSQRGNKIIAHATQAGKEKADG